MKTITLRVILLYLKRFGPFWTTAFCTKYFTARGTFHFTVPGYGARRFTARKGTSDVRVFNQVILRRSYEIPFKLPPARFIVDAGANVGYSALFFAHANPEATILAIEPDGSNFEMLCANAQDSDRVRPFHGALWPVKTRLSIKNPDAPKTAIKVGASDSSSGNVTTTTVPDIIREFGFIDILKVDIEGSEIEVFSGPHLEWLEHVGCLVIELHDFLRPGCSMAFYKAICQRQFRQHISGENLIIVFETQPKPGTESR